MSPFHELFAAGWLTHASAYTATGAVPIEAPALPPDGGSWGGIPGWSGIQMSGRIATGVLGSGKDYVYTPSN